MSHSPRKKPASPGMPDLDYELTQEIDPLLADIARATQEPTLSQIDFEEVEIALEAAPPRPAGRRG
jgi:hypothetical protein